MQISREVFDQQRRPRFGNSNPERMAYAFWEWMIRGDDIPPRNEKDPSKDSAYRPGGTERAQLCDSRYLIAFESQGYARSASVGPQP